MKVVVGFAFPREGVISPTAADVVRFSDPEEAERIGRQEFESAIASPVGDGCTARARYSFGKIVEPPSCFSLTPRLRDDLALVHLLGLLESLPVGTIVRPRLPPVPDGSVSELPPHVLAWRIEIVGPN